MRNNLKILVFITVLLAATALAIIALAAFGNSDPYAVVRRPSAPNPGDLEFYYIARAVISTINIVLLVVLSINYVNIFLKTRSEFTLGLTLFAVIFLMKDILRSPFIIRFGGFNLVGLGPFAFLPDLLELVALAVLLYLSVEY